MADGDIVGNILGKLRAAVDDYDVLLWDITDERLGVFGVPSGGYVSRVVDYRNGIYRGEVPLRRPVRIDSEAHKGLWLEALDRFVDYIERIGIKERLVLNVLPWATHDDKGEPVTGSNIDPAFFNTVLNEYSEAVEARGIQVARTDSTRVRQASEHQWGPAPFHYTPETYLASLEAVRAVVGLHFD